MGVFKYADEEAKEVTEEASKVKTEPRPAPLEQGAVSSGNSGSSPASPATSGGSPGDTTAGNSTPTSGSVR